jgi:hypothetical protein
MSLDPISVKVCTFSDKIKVALLIEINISTNTESKKNKNIKIKKLNYNNLKSC